ncbi:hypothetical protein Patl1_14582 [Pistacia atlantica]|uniref:Uncharacterized protein n=1 Tax=Pistacia atlantica TaxID=434234 RepID=A0ACC1AXD2_9ROSI|nr:hypothetical protein Patl1_14582 [Pistacia atlantica]
MLMKLKKNKNWERVRYEGSCSWYGAEVVPLQQPENEQLNKYGQDILAMKEEAESSSLWSSHRYHQVDCRELTKGIDGVKS